MRRERARGRIEEFGLVVIDARSGVVAVAAADEDAPVGQEGHRVARARRRHVRAGAGVVADAGETVDVAQEDLELDVAGPERVEEAAVGAGAHAAAGERFDGEAAVDADGDAGDLRLAAAEVDADGLRRKSVAGEVEARAGHAGDGAGVDARARARLGHHFDLDAQHRRAAAGEHDREGAGAHQWPHVRFTLPVVGGWLAW